MKDFILIKGGVFNNNKIAEELSPVEDKASQDSNIEDYKSDN